MGPMGKNACNFRMAAPPFSAMLWPMLPPSVPRHESRCLRWIGTLQVTKGLLLVALALGLLSFLHKDVDEIVALLMDKVGINVEGRHAAALLEWLDLVTDKQLFQLSALAFFFASVLVTQGTGLLMRKEWAKYLTLFATSALVPFEAYELFKGFGYGKLTVLLINVAIVAVMAFFVRRRGALPPACEAELASAPNRASV